MHSGIYLKYSHYKYIQIICFIRNLIHGFHKMLQYVKINRCIFWSQSEIDIDRNRYQTLLIDRDHFELWYVRYTMWSRSIAEKRSENNTGIILPECKFNKSTQKFLILAVLLVVWPESCAFEGGLVRIHCNIRDCTNITFAARGVQASKNRQIRGVWGLKSWRTFASPRTPKFSSRASCREDYCVTKPGRASNLSPPHLITLLT